MVEVVADGAMGISLLPASGFVAAPPAAAASEVENCSDGTAAFDFASTGLTPLEVQTTLRQLFKDTMNDALDANAASWVALAADSGQEFGDQAAASYDAWVVDIQPELDSWVSTLTVDSSYVVSPPTTTFEPSAFSWEGE